MVLLLGKVLRRLGTLHEESVVNLRDYLMIKEAAAFIGVSPNTLRNWERDGKLPTHRHPFNRYRLYKKADLEALLMRIDQSATNEQHAAS